MFWLNIFWTNVKSWFNGERECIRNVRKFHSNAWEVGYCEEYEI